MTRRPRKIYSTILYFAKSGVEFSPQMLTPIMPLDQVRYCCKKMALAGLLTRVQIGTPGIGGRNALYRLPQPGTTITAPKCVKNAALDSQERT